MTKAERFELAVKRTEELRKPEIELMDKGYNLIAGVDEVGRGPLAGPVVAAACIFDRDVDIVGIDDSKKLSEKKREQISGGKGDQKYFSIAAASILAKVTRDKLMKEYDKVYPEYGFASNKGYGTKAHYEGIKKAGITQIHRRSFLKNLDTH